MEQDLCTGKGSLYDVGFIWKTITIRDEILHQILYTCNFGIKGFVLSTYWTLKYTENINKNWCFQT